MAPLSVYALAAGAVVQLNEQGEIIRYSTRVVLAGWPQTAAAAGHLCIAISRQFCEEGVQLATDCGSVFLAALNGPAWAIHEKRPWAAVGADFGAHFGPVTKANAHLSLEQATAGGQGDLWRGNAAADSLCEVRANLHLPPEGLCQQLSKCLPGGGRPACQVPPDV